jgi:hypothetical protein
MNLNPVGWASAALRLLARLDSDGVNSTTPVTEINGGAISATNADIALVAKGTGATLAQVPDGTLVGGNKRGVGATDWQKSRNGIAQVASGTQATIGGGNANTVSSTYGTIAGGYGNTVQGSWGTVGGGDSNTASSSYTFVGGGGVNATTSSYSFIGGGQSNVTQTNTHATVCGGNNNTASGQYSFVGGGTTNTANGTYAFVGGGGSNIANSSYSSVLGGVANTANAERSCVVGGAYGTTRAIRGLAVFPSCASPIDTTAGVTQSALLLLGRQTTDATATVLTSNTTAAGTTNQVILPNNSAYSFSGEVIAGVTGGGNAARWTIDGAIKRGANAASTAMVGTATVTMTHNDAGAATWVVAVTADTTNGGIAVTVTGAAATTIRWVCRISTVEMTY